MARRVLNRVPYNIAYRAVPGDLQIPSWLLLCFVLLILFHVLPAKTPSKKESSTGCGYRVVLDSFSITFLTRKAKPTKVVVKALLKARTTWGTDVWSTTCRNLVAPRPATSSVLSSGALRRNSACKVFSKVVCPSETKTAAPKFWEKTTSAVPMDSWSFGRLAWMAVMGCYDIMPRATPLSSW